MTAPRSAPTLSRRDAIREQLKQDILEGRLAPGSRLRQQDVARRYGASIIPVREAFAELQGQGLLDLRGHHGATIAPLRGADVEDVFDVRAVVEPLAVRLSVPYLEPAQLGRMRAIVAELGRRATKDLRWAALNQEFHALVVSRAGRPVLYRILMLLRDAVRFHVVHLPPVAGLDTGQREHEAILRACLRGSAGDAARCTRRHILSTKRRLLLALRRRQIETGRAPGDEWVPSVPAPRKR